MAVSSDFDLEWKRLSEQLDVVERHAATTEERARVLRLKQALSGSDVLGALCHDLKDPLAAILMGSALLKKQAEASRAVGALVNAANRLDRIVMNTRDLDALRRGSLVAQLRKLPVASVIQPHVERMRAGAAAKNVTLAVDAVEVWALGDSNATARIVDELLDNAIGFAPAGSAVQVTVASERARNAVLVHFDDEGAGIDAEHLPFAFDEARNRSHRPRRGAGRGLPIAAAYAELQGGSLELSTRSPRGFRATLVMKVAP
jgi:two-component system sensor histidine kinase CreC